MSATMEKYIGPALQVTVLLGGLIWAAAIMNGDIRVIQTELKNVSLKVNDLSSDVKDLSRAIRK